MFNSLNISQEMIEVARKILASTDDIPGFIIDAAKNAAIDIKKCNNLEDKKLLMESYLMNALEENKVTYTTEYYLKFDFAVQKFLS